MATNDQDLIISIQADSKKAVESLDAVRAQLEQMNLALTASNEHLKKTEDALSGFGLAVVKINEGLELAHKAFEAIHKVFDVTVEKFIEADDTVKGLSNTLSLLGEKDVAGATAHFKEFAEELEHHSTVSEETTLKLIALAKAMGRTDEQAQSLARTSANLSAVNHDSVQSNFDKLTNTFKGVTRGVEIYDTSIKQLTESQVRQGAALAVLDKDYQGFAEKSLNTIGGQAKQVQILMQHTLENVGELFAVFFKLDDKSFAINSLREINEYIKSLVPTVKAVREAITDEFQHIANAFGAVTDKAGALKEALIALGVIIALAFGSQIIAQITAMTEAVILGVKAVYALASAWTASIAAALPAIALYAGIAVGILAIGAALDIALRNGEKFWEFIKDIASAIADVFKALGTAIIEYLDPTNWFKPGSFDKVGESLNKALQDIRTSATKNQIDFGFAGTAFKSAQEFISGYNQQLDKTVKSTEDVNAGTGRLGKAFDGMSKEAQQAFDNLSKKVEELKLKQVELGQNTNLIAAQRLNLELKQIDVLEKELKDRGGLNKAAQDLLKTARETAAANSGAEVYEKQRKALLDISAKTKDLQLGVDSFNKTQAEVIDLQLQRQLELLDLKSQELDKQGLLTDAVKQQIEAQKGLLQTQASQAKEKAPNPIAESMTIAGQNAGKAVTDAFAPLMGLTSGIGAYVAAAQAVVDAGPQLLESITHLLDSITALPGKILEDVGKLLDSVITLIENLLPNIVKAVIGIFAKVGDFLKKLPDVLISAIMQIPALVDQLLDALPDLIQKIVEALIVMSPKITMALVEFMIKDSPRIALKLAEYLAFYLPKAIIQGIADALKEIGGMISNLFKGKFDFLDPKKLEKDVTDVLKKVSASASRIFAVASLTDAAQDASKIKADIQKDVDKSLQKLKDAWQWVWDHILKPIIDALYKVWQWVWDNILHPIIDLVMKAFQWVWDNVLEPIVDLVMKAFKWAWEHVLEPITNLVMKAFQWVWDNIFSPFYDYVKVLFTGIWNVFKASGKYIADLFSASWNLFKNVFGSLWASVKKIWDDMMDLFTGKINLLAGLKTVFSDLFNGIYNTLKTIFDSVTASFQKFIDGAKNIGSSMWDGFKGALDGAGKFFTNIGDSIWGGIKAGFDGAAKFFTGIGDSIWKGLKSGLDGLGDFFKNLFNSINPSSLFEKIFSIPSSAWDKSASNSPVETILGINIPYVKFAGGGVVPGTAAVGGDSEINDKIVALLSPGEAIISRSKLNNPVIKSLVDLIVSGKFNPPKFFGGSFGAAISSAAKSVGSAVSSGAKTVSSTVQKTVSDVVNLTPEKALEELKKGAKVAADVIKLINPAKLWDLVRDKINDAIMSIFKGNAFSEGGYVGGHGLGDTVPAMLDPREYVMRPSAVQKIGVNNLNAMNAGHSMGSTVTYNFDIPITIKNDGKDIDANWVRTKVLPTIEDELKKASLSGRFVLSQKGIRNA